ncbi:LysR family transcriptional regulator [Conservatibacter flavescens]|uniref:LysR family transcriptional regulator n=1 Tax=Conservatibacter flavescens TaxID=28161 RepID=A0A2M8S5C8_9PAST|nr:LysR family transcriptional regulator [Conservatibacter flavescens]PJG86355.1 LysR family transcriptional regulator [Conservatibacter flavescens]
MDILSGVQAFVLVAENKSFAAAARHLALSPSAISKLIARLEDHLGVKLLHRNTRSISLTAEGTQFLVRCRHILGEWDNAKNELSQTHAAPSGKLRVSLPDLDGFFLPVISGFTDQFPDICLEVDFSDRLVDIIEEGFDVVVRTGKAADSRLTAKFLTHYRMHLVGSPAYFAKHGVPMTPSDLRYHQCIQYRFAHSGKTEIWPLTDSERTPPLTQSVICNNTEARLQLALMGKGIACIPDFLAEPHIRQGRLVSVLPEYLNWQGTYQLLWAANPHQSPKLRAFIDYFAQYAFRRAD